MDSLYRKLPSLLRKVPVACIIYTVLVEMLNHAQSINFRMVPLLAPYDLPFLQNGVANAPPTSNFALVLRCRHLPNYFGLVSVGDAGGNVGVQPPVNVYRLSFLSENLF